MEYDMKCKKCEKEFKVKVTDMKVPGGKDREYILCPYCNEENGSEITSGFVYTYKLEKEEHKDEAKEQIINN